jgi:hypothetical protein
VTLDLGDPVRMEMTKWGNRPHWQFDALWLGSDRHGDWIGLPTGTEFHRPGAHFVSKSHQVGLTPLTDVPDAERWFAATFHAPGAAMPIEVYVDITTPPVWDGSTLRTVDLDLDVIRAEGGRIWVDDEDEFAEHRVQLAYPDEVVQAAMRSCDRVEKAMRSGLPPYDGSHALWLQRLVQLTDEAQ